MARAVHVPPDADPDVAPELAPDVVMPPEAVPMAPDDPSLLAAVPEDLPGIVDPELHAALMSDVPTLLLSGEADPVTPPADAERLAHGLRRHRHLILSGEGHGQAATGCVPRLMADFLDLPDPSRLDAACLERHRPAAFFVRTSGPAP